MPAHREIELKLTIAPEDVVRLRGHPLLAAHAVLAPTTSRVENRYFDTPDCMLEAHRMALRLRRIDRRWLQTLKTDAEHGSAMSARGEWEMPVARGRLELQKFAATPLADLAPWTVLAQTLKPIFSTDFERESWILSFADQTRATFTIDRGTIAAGPRNALRTEPICEVEAELEGGEPLTLLDFVRRLSKDVPLTPSTSSKAARGHAIAVGATSKPIKLHFSVNRADGRTGAELQRFMHEAVHALSANAHGIANSDDPEFVHQARVTIRRVRSVLRAHRRWLGSMPAARLDRRLQGIGHTLGAARDLDVLCLQTLPALDLPARLIVQAQALRRQAATRARAAIRDGMLGRSMLEMESFALRLAGTALPMCADSMQHLLPRLHRRVQRRARKLAALDVSGLHRLRIAVKHLRYGIDFYGSLVDDAARDEYQHLLVRLQDALGGLNDLQMAGRLVAQCSEQSPSIAQALAERAEHATRERLPAIAGLLVQLELAPLPWRAIKAED